jgi:hypothetical protein
MERRIHVSEGAPDMFIEPFGDGVSLSLLPILEPNHHNIELLGVKHL